MRRLRMLSWKALPVLSFRMVTVPPVFPVRRLKDTVGRVPRQGTFIHFFMSSRVRMVLLAMARTSSNTTPTPKPSTAPLMMVRVGWKEL